MKRKLTLEEYKQKIVELLLDSDMYRPEDFEKAYQEYCKLKGRKILDTIRIDLLKEPYFIENSNVKGYFSQFWLVLSDLNKYLLKEIPSGRFFLDQKGLYTRDNAIIVPRLIKYAGLDTAEYYFVNWIMDDSVNTWEDEFLLTPSFLKEGDELLSFKDILGQECLDIEILEKRLRKELELRHFNRKNIEEFMKDLRRKICMSEIIDNTDISGENMSIIINNGSVRVAPLYDFDFCMGNKAIVRKHFKVRGQEGLAAVLEYYKDDEDVINWLRKYVMTIDINKLVSMKVSTPNRGLIEKEARYMYKDFWKQQMDIIKKFVEFKQHLKTDDKELT